MLTFLSLNSLNGYNFPNISSKSPDSRDLAHITAKIIRVTQIFKTLLMFKFILKIYIYMYNLTVGSVISEVFFIAQNRK